MTFGHYDYAAFLSFFAYAAGSVVVPVALVTMAKDMGFTLEEGGMTEGGALHVARTVPLVGAMLICGFAAGRWGKRRTIGVSVALMGVGVLLCALAPTYGVLFLALMVAGAGEGVVEGLATPFVQDLHPVEPGRYINFTHSFWSVGVTVTVLAAGAALSFGVHWRLIVGTVAALGLFAAILLLLPPGKGQQCPEHPEPIHWRTTWEHAKEILRIRRFWLFFTAMFLAGGGEFCLTFWCASFVQLSFKQAAWAGGVATACFAVGMFLGRTGWGFLIRQHQLKRLVVYSALAGAAITLFVPVITSLWVLLVFLFFAGIATAPFWPSVQSYSDDCLPQTDTTMLFILLSCAGVPGCGFFTLLMGYLGDHFGDLGPAFYLVPACYLALGALIAIDSFLGARKPAAGKA